MLSWLCY